MASKETLIVDCDTGIDDALALLYLLRDSGVDTRAVTTVFGNVDAVTAADNTLRVLELAGRPDIPVAIGARSNWHGDAHLALYVRRLPGAGTGRRGRRGHRPRPGAARPLPTFAGSTGTSRPRTARTFAWCWRPTETSPSC
ncbi:nucleoside hydrolase [Saccharopolyspora phatthalungensis]|uniref:Inosine/uridine-preferring nucleoside hydrolase domain-containing protein n=1 Tax=Saccharopolyspora phatthalungensis TaxID=664693 RepID=A0A840Q8G1_9PSEU|nr:nucleoside hydrolase [Saccharopolyspora phatthalungensis]MBB5154909.1 hypothetical protein [Saccharopolyspora phatthalungensis]